MPYIAPNSTIRILHGVPIDMKYTHSLWFTDYDAQTNYFISKSKATFPACSYVRQNAAYIKVPISSDSIADCNYLMYQNTAFNNKWFYAFIESIEYISNNVCGITFVIDHLQTWLFEMRMGECYIERQHSTTDNEGDNLIPENLETGEYMYSDNNMGWSHIFSSYDVLALTTFASNYTTTGGWVFTRTEGTYRWGIYTGLNMRVFRHIENSDTVTLLNNFLTFATETYGEENGVVALLMIPTDALSEGMNPNEITVTVPKITALDGYAPVNKKLLTYPYCFVEGQNGEGSVATFMQEFFLGGTAATCQFEIGFNITAAPNSMCVPIAYKGASKNYSEAFYINNFPECSYNTDLFKAYMAQSLVANLGQTFVDGFNEIVGQQSSNALGNPNKYRELTSGRNSRTSRGGNTFSTNISDLARNWISQDESRGLALAGATLGIGTAIATGNAGELLSDIYSSMSTMYSRSVAANHNNGSNTPDYMVSKRLKGFWFFHRTITNEFARKIDAYFSRFGYAQHKIDVPNLHARERFTFIKTSDCHIDGYLPAEAVESIQNIFDGGITFWADHDNVGNYGLSNPIV